MQFSIANIAVKIFVVLAGYNFLFSFFPYKILPVEESIKTAPYDASVKLVAGAVVVALTGFVYINILIKVVININIINIFFLIFIC